jgi:hypothetical protein
MARVKASVVHDEGGRIISVSRPSELAKVNVLSGDGQSVFETEVEEDDIVSLVDGRHAVDVERKSIVSY